MSSNTQIDLKKCKAEMKIVGYLLGCKVAKHDARYVPEGINQYHTLPLRSLNQMATRAYLEYQKEADKSVFGKVSQRLARLWKS